MLEWSLSEVKFVISNTALYVQIQDFMSYFLLLKISTSVYRHQYFFPPN